MHPRQRHRAGALTRSHSTTVLPPTGDIATVQDRKAASRTTRSTCDLVRSFGEDPRIADCEVNPKKHVGYDNFEFERRAFFDHVIEAGGKTVAARRSIDGGTLNDCTNTGTIGKFPSTPTRSICRRPIWTRIASSGV